MTYNGPPYYPPEFDEDRLPTLQGIADAVDQMADKFNERRARYYADAEKHRQQAAEAGHRIDRVALFEVAYTQEMRASEAKSAYMDFKAISIALHEVLDNEHPNI